MAFRFDKLTIKAQEAVPARAGAGRRARAIRRSSRCTCWRRCWPKSDGIVRPVLDKIGANRGAARTDRRGRAEASAQGLAAARRRSVGRQLQQGARRGPDAKPTTMKDEFVSTEHLLLALAKVDIEGQERAQAQRHRRRRRCSRRCKPVRGSRPRDRSEPRGQVPGPARSTASTWSSGPARASSTR